MNEQNGDMFEDYIEPDVLYVIPTNGFVKNNQRAVMGAGVARDANQLQRNLDKWLGDLLLAWGNRPYLLPGNMVSFPTKHHWKERSDLDLITRNLPSLRDLWARIGKPRLYLPRVGCGNGGLSWYIVRPFVEDCFGTEDNVTIWRWEEEL